MKLAKYVIEHKKTDFPKTFTMQIFKSAVVWSFSSKFRLQVNYWQLQAALSVPFFATKWGPGKVNNGYSCC